MQTYFINAALTGVVLATSSLPASGSEPRCAPRDHAINQLSERYGEQRQFMGLNLHGVVEVFASDTTGTWTITVTTPQGVTCIVAAGENYLSNPGPIATGPGV
jgi:hypothetical protein